MKCFLSSINKSTKCFNLSGSINSRLSQFDNRLGLFLRISLSDKVGLTVRTRNLSQRLGQNLSGKPTALSQRLSERSVLLDHGVDICTHVFSSTFQCVLEDLATHARVDDRVPVHKTHSTGSKSLRKLIHSLRSLHGTRTGHSSQVSNTLNSRHRFFQANASRGKRTDVTRHLGEVVNRHVCILVQLIESCINLAKRRTLTLRIRKNGLNSANLRLILLETSENGINRHRFSNISSSRHSRIRNCGHRSDACDLKRRKSSLDGLNTLLKPGHIDVFSGFINFLKSFGRTLKIKSLLKLLDSRHRGLYTSFELLIVKPHFNNSLIYSFTHRLVTSLHASSAILSKIGWIAGLM